MGSKWTRGKIRYIPKKSILNYLKIYSDGSENNTGCVGIGIYIPKFKINISKRISDQLSVFKEMVASILSLQWVDQIKPDRVVLNTDSKAFLKVFSEWKII